MGQLLRMTELLQVGEANMHLYFSEAGRESYAGSQGGDSNHQQASNDWPSVLPCRPDLPRLHVHAPLPPACRWGQVQAGMEKGRSWA